MIAAVAMLALLVSEALGLYVFAEWAAAGYRPGSNHAVDWVVFVVVVLVAFAIPRLVEWLDLTRRVALVLTGVAAYVVIYGSIRVVFHGDLALWDVGWLPDFLGDAEKTLAGATPVLLATMMLVALWVRGTMRSDDEIDMETIPRAVGIPFGLVTGILIASIYTERSHEVAVGGAAYYAVAVVALACSQLARSGATYGDVRAGGTTAVLLGATFGVTALCVLVFWVLFAVLGPTLGPPLGQAAEKILFVVLYPPAWLLEQLFRFLFHGANPLADINLPNAASGVARQAGPERAEDRSLLKAIGSFLATIAVLLLLVLPPALAIYLAARFRRRRRRLLEADAMSARAGGLREDASDLLRALFRRQRHPGADADSAARRLYREVLERAEGAGQVRRTGETPDEFAPRLQEAFHTDVTDEITAAFEQARYAGREPDPRAIAELEARWRAAR